MQITGQTIDDFKTPRKDLLPALPVVYRIIPIIFYLALLFVAVVGSLAMWHKRVALMRYQDLSRQKAEAESEIKATKELRARLEYDYRESTQLYDWVESSMPLQPLVVAIVKKCTEEGAKIVEFSLERDAQIPAQIRFSITVNTTSDTTSDTVIQSIIDVIRRMNYLEFSPTQSKVRGNIEYRALLIRNKTGKSFQTPEDRKNALNPS